MSDSLTAPGGPIKRTIGDKEVILAELSFFDRSELAKEFRRRKRDEKVALLKETVGTLEDHAVEVQQLYYDELNKFDTSYYGNRVWFDYFNSDEGKLGILERSLKLAGEDPALAKKYGGADLMDLCAALTHTPLITTPMSDNQNPQKPNATEKPPKAFGQAD